MILNSGRHTQPDPQSCRVRSLGGRRGGAQKQTTHQETKTKLSSATPNRDKTIHCQRKHRKKHPASNVAAESAPHPRHVAKACDNNTQTIPNNMVLLAKIGNMQAGLETFNQQPCSPESCHSGTLAKVLLFRKKGHCSNLIFGAVNTLAFWTPRSGPPQYSKSCEFPQ